VGRTPKVQTPDSGNRLLKVELLQSRFAWLPRSDHALSRLPTTWQRPITGPHKMTTIKHLAVVCTPTARARAILPKDLKSACARIALERSRPLAWLTASDLRKKAQLMLAAGSSALVVEAHLDGLLADALKVQWLGVQ
jgi:hypothetical protein